jgi:hypothetical protein
MMLKSHITVSGADEKRGTVPIARKDSPIPILFYLCQMVKKSQINAKRLSV